MTYYQVEFAADAAGRRRPKRFRTEEMAKRVLGIAEAGSLESRATILPVSKNRTPLS